MQECDPPANGGTRNDGSALRLLLLAIPAETANRLLDRYPHLARDLGQSLESRRQAIVQAKEGKTARTQVQLFSPFHRNAS